MREKALVRKAYGEALCEYGALNPKLVVLVADVSSSVMTHYFAQRFPERFFNVGIEEQGMVDTAVGFALGGFIPFCNTFSALFLRAIEQIRTCVAYAKTNVKLVGGYSGLSDFKDGPTHHCIIDLGIMRSMPNFTVVEPADAVEAKKMVPLVAECPGPVYLRLSRAATPVIFDETHRPEIGKGITLLQGGEVTIISCGSMVARSLEAAKILEEEGVKAGVINMHTLKPLDKELILKVAEETGTLVTVEEHSVIGGLGSAVAEVLGESCPVPLERVGIRDTFTETALDYESLLDHYGLSVEEIIKAVKRVLLPRGGRK